MPARVCLLCKKTKMSQTTTSHASIFVTPFKNTGGHEKSARADGLMGSNVRMQRTARLAISIFFGPGVNFRIIAENGLNGTDKKSERVNNVVLFVDSERDFLYPHLCFFCGGSIFK